MPEAPGKDADSTQKAGRSAVQPQADAAPNEGQPISPRATSSTQPTITVLRINNNFLEVRAAIAAKVEGTCTLTLTKSGSTPIKSEAKTVAEGEQTTCLGWDIGKSALSKGTWTATVQMTASNFNATSAPKTISIP